MIPATVPLLGTLFFKAALTAVAVESTSDCVADSDGAAVVWEHCPGFLYVFETRWCLPATRLSKILDLHNE